jgi:hypothetical protein|nr:MAG TPA: hypothetical protein [Caudoviricetes sp.]
MGLFGKIKRAVKKVFGGGNNLTPAPTPAPEIGMVDADTSDTTEEQSEKEQVTTAQKKGKRGLKITLAHTGRNIT